jgi:hypothetical protein
MTTTRGSIVYQTTRWRTLRRTHITAQPLCEQCLRDEIVTPAVAVCHAGTPLAGPAFWSGPFIGKVVVTTGVDGYPI